MTALSMQLMSIKNLQIVESLPSFKETFTMSEILALKKNEYGEPFLCDTERIMNILKNHENWLQKEHIFWEWMVKYIPLTV